MKAEQLGRKNFSQGFELDSPPAILYDTQSKASTREVSQSTDQPTLCLGPGMSGRDSKGRRRSDPTDRSDSKNDENWLLNDDPAVVANAVICLIHQANYLLDRQIAGLERQFIQEGGYTERLAAARIDERCRQRRPEQPSSTRIAVQKAPVCPKCGEPMALRTARKGKNAGAQFWGCCSYPECNGVRQID
jgi:restriction system protein